MTNANTNSRKTPSFIGLDNQKIHWASGVDIPYKRGIVPSFTSGTTPATLTTNIDRKQLQLKLDITPHISADDSVLLEIDHSDSDLGADQADLGPTWTTQEFTTSLVVHDQQTVVLEGLVQEHDSDSTVKVPLLGDIPLLGYFFKYRSHVKKKTNLLIMLTPYIIKDERDLQRIRERKVREHDDFVRSVATLDAMPYAPKLDYARKRGVVEEINRAVEEVEDETAARQAIQRAKPVGSGLVPVAPALAP
jgi:general secretion pathway protein D